jgi:TolA-binding protein
MTKNSVVLVIASLFCVVFSSCKNVTTTAQKSVRDSIITTINANEKELFANASSSPISNAKAQETIALYEKFASTFPKDSLAPKYLMKAADICSNTNQAAKSVELCRKIVEQYPNFKDVPTALFLMAFVTENKLQNIPRAKELYQEFIQKYPNHPMAKDAKASIENLGLSDEELMAKFQKMNS